VRCYLPDDMLNCFDRILKCVRQMYGQTDGCMDTDHIANVAQAWRHAVKTV